MHLGAKFNINILLFSRHDAYSHGAFHDPHSDGTIGTFRSDLKHGTGDQHGDTSWGEHEGAQHHVQDHFSNVSFMLYEIYAALFLLQKFSQSTNSQTFVCLA